MPENRDQSNLHIRELLEALRETGNVGAWHTFLEQYAPVLFLVAKQYANNEEEANDCFLHLCEKLCAGNCDRLQRFEPERGTSFKTWLIAITSNLCIDWRRSVSGRSTTPRAIQALPELEQLTYRYRVEQILDLETCLLAMRRFYPDLSRERLSEASASVHTALSSKQRWSISARTQRGHLSLDELRTVAEPIDLGPGPHRNTEAVQEQQALQSALSRLSPQQQLILRLRFEQELSLDDVAHVAGLGDLYQARRLIQAALETLQELLADYRTRP